MSKKTDNAITTYLLKNCPSLEEFVGEDNRFKKDNHCFKDTLDNLFAPDSSRPFIPCHYYEQVAFGEGNEQNKIYTVFSSSLQSLLVFSQVSEGNPISIDGISYTHVQFEYKNKVINTPSSVDVVLSDKNNENVLFIESKLREIVEKANAEYVIGPSYFSSDENGYGKLQLEKEELDGIGIHVSLPKLYEKSANEVKTKIASRDNEKGYVKVEPINNSPYVYSYGIKQILSHIIGIMNLHNPGKNCSADLKDFVGNIRFVSLYNELPDFDEEATKKQNAYVEHEKKVGKLIQEKKEIIECALALPDKACSFDFLPPMTYQDICKENCDYFNLKEMEIVVKFYHLKG